MIPVNRDTVMMIATIVCAIGIIFLFKELNKTKQEMNSFKNFSSQVVRHLSAPEPVRTCPRTQKGRGGDCGQREGINISSYYNLRMRNEKVQSDCSTG